MGKQHKKRYLTVTIQMKLSENTGNEIMKDAKKNGMCLSNNALKLSLGDQHILVNF